MPGRSRMGEPMLAHSLRPRDVDLQLRARSLRGFGGCQMPVPNESQGGRVDGGDERDVSKRMLPVRTRNLDDVMALASCCRRIIRLGHHEVLRGREAKLNACHGARCTKAMREAWPCFDYGSPSEGFQGRLGVAVQVMAGGDRLAGLRRRLVWRHRRVGHGEGGEAGLSRPLDAFC
jgi:hypothetical protein